MTEALNPDLKSQAFELAQNRCADSNLRLESDDYVYNTYGIAVARYNGWEVREGQLMIKFENLLLETRWEHAKVLNYGRERDDRRKDGPTGCEASGVSSGGDHG